MPIYSSDIRTRQAAVEGQYPDSGGRIHPTDYVVHHEVGGLLPKLTEVDHAGGRVDLAKCYLSIETPGTEQGDDCYTYLDLSPTDPLVDAVLFRPATLGNRAGHIDERADAQSYVEAYQIAGAAAPWYLRGRHTAGMRTLILWSRESQRLPEVGQTLYLSALETSGGAYSQYVQISDYSYETQIFLAGDEEYPRRVIYASITAPLGAEYTGPEVAKTDPSSSALDGSVRIRETVVADGSRYYGHLGLAAPATAGDYVVTVPSIYGQIVPSARGETPLSALSALNAGTQDISSGGQTFSVSGPVHTEREEVTTATRRNNWTRVLQPIPAAGGAVWAHVRILDRWYTVVENEASTIGTITCNRGSGSTLLSLSALPDADTWIIWEWPSAIHFADRAGTLDISAPQVAFDLPERPDPGSVSIDWVSGGVAKSVSFGADGAATGDATGYLVGEHIWLSVPFAALPDAGTDFSYTYDPLTTVTESWGPSGTFTLSDPPAPGSVVLTWAVSEPGPPDPPMVTQATPSYPSRIAYATGSNIGAS